MNVNEQQEGYQNIEKFRTYKKEGRYYKITFNGQKLEYPSVTTILNTINKPFLINWAAKKTQEYVYKNLSDTAPDKICAAWPHIVEDSTKSHKESNEYSKNRGTAIHNCVESYFLEETLKIDLKYEFDYDKFISELEKWVTNNNFKPLKIGDNKKQVEQLVYSHKYKYAGTCDLYGTVDIMGEPERALIDFKTGNNVYRESKLQLAAYSTAITEMTGRPVDRAFILHILPGATISKKMLIRHSDIGVIFPKFLSLRDFFDWHVNTDGLYESF